MKWVLFFIILMPKTDGWLKLYIGQQVLDGLLTSYAMKLGAKEMNPLGKSMVEGGDVWKFKAMTAGPSILAAKKLKEVDEKKYKKAMIGLNLLYGAILLNNLYQLR